MAKYINKFDTLAEYNAAKYNLDYPSINYVTETDGLIWQETKPSITGQVPTFGVVDDIGYYFETTFDEVYDLSTEKWNMLNSNGEYEEYGIMGDGLNIPTYEGKLTIDDGYEYVYSGVTWEEVGEVVSGETSVDLSDSIMAPVELEGKTIPTSFKITKPTFDGDFGTVEIAFNGRNGENFDLTITYFGEEYFSVDYRIEDYSGTYTDDGEYFNFYLEDMDAPSEFYIAEVEYIRMDGVSNTLYFSYEGTDIPVKYPSKDEKPYGVISFSSATDASSSTDVYYGLAANIEGNSYVYTSGNTFEPITPTSLDYLKFIALEDGKYTFDSDTNTDMEISYDQGNSWHPFIKNSLSVDEGATVMLKYSGTSVDGTFGSTNDFDVEGNAMSLLYGDNFNGQTDLTGKDYAFHALFSGCIHLISAENLVLPATTLADHCYQWMFHGCTSLTTAPELPATILEDSCYNGMFYACRALTTAPELPATILEDFCYNQMFFGCTNLSAVTCLAIDTEANNSTNYWLDGVAANGVFTTPSISTWLIGSSGIPQNWTREDAEGLYRKEEICGVCVGDDYYGVEVVKNSEDGGETWNIIGQTTFVESGASRCESYDYSQDYLTLANIGNNDVTFKLCMYNIDSNLIQYSLNKIDWTTLSVNETFVLPKGKAFFFRGEYCTDYTSVGFAPQSYNGKVVAQGNVMSLIYGDDFVGKTDLTNHNWAFQMLFYDGFSNRYYDALYSAENLILPATTLSDRCYQQMFWGCRKLTKAPQLHATTLAYCCYNHMFHNCQMLTTAPELLATTLASNCYEGMFYGCTSLTSITCLATDISASYCTSDWVNNVSSTGTFVKASGMNDWESGNNGIPENWTVEDAE